MLYGLERPTADIDFLSLAPSELIPHVLELAGEGSPLHEKYKVYLQHVTIVDLPDESNTRLTSLFPFMYSRLRLLALDPYDLALTKLRRNATHDREDVKQLAIRIPLDAKILKQRHEKELRPYLAPPEREDLTIQLWTEMIAEMQGKVKRRRNKITF